MKIHYLEVVTEDIDAACALYSKLHNIKFGVADKDLGSARIANLGVVQIRVPPHIH